MTGPKIGGGRSRVRWKRPQSPDYVPYRHLYRRRGWHWEDGGGVSLGVLGPHLIHHLYGGLGKASGGQELDGLPILPSLHSPVSTSGIGSLQRLGGSPLRHATPLLQLAICSHDLCPQPSKLPRPPSPDPGPYTLLSIAPMGMTTPSRIGQNAPREHE